jgi:large subunit ribosomal protein L18
VSLIRKAKQRRKRRELRVRSSLTSKRHLPRVSIFRSLKHFYGQLIDDVKGVTIASCSSLELEKLSGDKKNIAKSVGMELSKRSLKKGISEACFDRGRFLYHGRVKLFADGLREGGLKI